jgi:hypothetical protein
MDEKIKDQNMEERPIKTYIIDPYVREPRNRIQISTEGEVNLIFNFDVASFQLCSIYIHRLIKKGIKAKVELDFFDILRMLKKEYPVFMM